MKKRIVMFLAAAMAAFGAWADTETVGGYTWTYWNYGSGAEVAGVEPATGTVTIPSTLGGSPVTKVRNSAFYGCSGLTGVSIPSSVMSIESYAFYGCSGLRNVAIPVSVKTLGGGVFQNCTSIESVSIPVSITAIPYNAFYGCTSLRTLDLPVTVKSIGSYAFYGCVSLSSVSIPFSVKSIGDYSFYGCSSLSNLELSGGLESIGYNAFYGCNGLREVVIPASVTSVSSYAFGVCGNIRRVTVPECVLHNMSSVFGDSCSTITSLAITEGVKSIDSSSFYNCDGLTSISIPASVTRIGESVFRYSCPALSEITIAPGNANYKFSGGLLLTKDGKEIVAVPRGRTWVSIPDTVTKIGRETFNNCPNLNFTWRNGVKSIDGWVLGCDGDDLPKNFTLSGYRGIANGAFSYCEALTGITIGEGVKSIGAYSFEECSNLTSISIPASVTHMDDSAFDGCYRISSINLSSGNKNYKYTGGLLVSADNTELVAASRTATSVKIPEGVSCVRSGFFAGCTKLTSVTFPSSVEEIGDEGSVFGGWEEIDGDDDWYYKFHGCPALKTIIVAPGNQYYKSVNGMLLGMDDGDLFLKAVPQSLTSVNVPEGVQWLSSSAFVGCSKLTVVTFPRSLYEYDGELYYNDDEDDIDESSGPYKLTSINVAAGNEEYSSANGLLLSADGTEIYEVPRGLTSVTIPASVTDVYADDFEYCTKLKSFSVEKNSKTHSSVNGMLLSKDGSQLICVPAALKTSKTVTIPQSVKSIGARSFSDFDQLTAIVVPEGVTEIGRSAFSGCESLAKVALPTTLEKIGDSAFYGCRSLLTIKIPDSVYMIGADAFAVRVHLCCAEDYYDFSGGIYDTNSIPGFVLVDGWLVKVLDSFGIDEYGSKYSKTYSEYLNDALADPRLRGVAAGIFSSNDARLLLNVSLPPCVKYVADGLFADCSSLERVDLPEGLRGIGSRTFANCYRLNGVSISDSVRSVAGDAFQGCSFIDRDSIPGLQLVDGWILKDDNISWYLSQDESFNGELVISGEQGIRGIADSAFATGRNNVCCGLSTSSGLSGVTRLIINDGVTAIGSQAFAACDDLTDVYVAASVKYIGEKAFYDCRGLKSVQLPDTLKGKIPDSVFAKCPESLKIIYYDAPRPVHVVDFYDNYSAHTEYVHAGSSSVDKGKRGDVRNGQWNYDEGLYVWTLAVSVPNGRLQSFWMTGMTENSNVWLIDVEGRYSYKEDGETYEGYVYPSEWKTIANHNGGVNEFMCLTEADWSYVPASVKYVTFTITVTGTNDSAADKDCQFYFGIGNTSNFPDDDNMIPIHYSDWLESREIEEGRAIGELPEISRKQCRFLGWSTAPEGGEKVSAMTLMGESDVAYYAHWWCYGDVFEGVGLSALDEDDNIIVTLTNDVSGMVEIPDNVGSVTIDLNGHDIVGDDGPAIRIVKGDGESGGDVAATRLAIVDTSEGEKGQISGGGESAGIEVAEDAATGVKLDVEEGVGVFNGDGSEQELKPKLVGTGKVTVPRTWKVGQKVTWKATADKGNVFARWEGPLVDSLNLTKNERRNPSLAFAVPEGFETNMVTAVFIPIDDDGLYTLGITQTEFELKEAVSDVCVTDDSLSYVTATASGLPTGLKFDAKKMTIAGTPTKSGVYWVQIKAKNASGYQWAENVMVTVSGDGKEAKEPKLTRTAYYPLTVICANYSGTVSGTGVYAEGKKVSVKATPAKGYVFAGWHETANSEKGTVNGVDGADYRSASLNVTVPETRYVFALFATKEDDADSLKVAVEDVTTEKDGTIALNLGACVESLSLPKLAVSGLPSGVKYDAKTLKLTGKATKPGVYTVTVKATNAAVTKATDASTATFRITVPNFECAALPMLKPETDAYGIVRSGVIFDDGLVDCTPADGWTVKVAGLPSGLKWDAKTGKIVGVPTAKAGSYTVTFTASKKGEAKQVATITLNVEALPDWVVGTFYGKNVARGLRGAWTCPQQFTVTISANGKISMKTVSPGEGAESRTAQLTECREDGSFAFSFHYASGRKGKDGYSEGDCAGIISPVAYGEDGALLGCLTTQDIGVCDEDDDPFESKGVVYQSIYSRKPAVSGLPVFGKDNIRVVPVKSDFSDGEVTLKFGTKGAVTAAWSGTKPIATCSSYISPYARDADGTVHAKLWLTFLDKTRIDGYGDFVQTGFEFDLLIPASDKVSASDVDVVSARLTSIIADVLNGDDVELVQQ